MKKDFKGLKKFLTAERWWKLLEGLCVFGGGVIFNLIYISTEHQYSNMDPGTSVRVPVLGALFVAILPVLVPVAYVCGIVMMIRGLISALSESSMLKRVWSLPNIDDVVKDFNDAKLDLIKDERFVFCEQYMFFPNYQIVHYLDVVSVNMGPHIDQKSGQIYADTFYLKVICAPDVMIFWGTNSHQEDIQKISALILHKNPNVEMNL